MIDVYLHKLTVPAEAIDINNHVNNLQYIRWTLHAAIAHSAANGWDTDRYKTLGAWWLVRAHNFTYFRQSFLGEDVIVKTWVADMHKVRSLRKYLIIRPSDHAVLVRGETQWALVNAAGKPSPIPQELSECFPIVSTENEPGLE